MFNFAVAEEGVSISSPFANVYYDRNAGVAVRSPIPVEVVRAVQLQCYQMDDEMRWLVALVADTGMRLAGSEMLHLFVSQPGQIAHDTPLKLRGLKHATERAATNSMGPEPSKSGQCRRWAGRTLVPYQGAGC
ncbi:hypothetical protein [Leisingera sp. ANG-M1]|uniref:hypothetical protein n=1 Tax=Leisingera sp. ANG-M1 TaxID=1577895 RepID=UPI0006925104|nr:hypothetical protein [Leisingera sp. ANG-M1]